MRINVVTKKQPAEMDSTELVQYIKYMYPQEPRAAAYSRFVQLRNLKPEIDAKEFNQIFETVYANSYETVATVDFRPTHRQKQTGLLVEVVLENNDSGIKRLLFENGSTGTHPADKFLEKEYQFEAQYEPV